jgi:CheY-like chemotaxis protein
MDLGHTNDRLRVLVVDDDPDTADCTATLVTLAGFDVRLATSGEEALRLAEECPPDVVVFDLLMTGMDGGDVAEHFRNQAGGRRPFLVAVTGGPRWRSAAAGVDLHLDKPVEPAVLVGALRRFARLLTPA